ncbi:YkvA family protein [Anabaena sp. CCY 9402-a]|uniref:YkvA family protein n=1 Tax=Anabaena sp. CCY 9402-a TaxID=3103867 RepID=UPI0039C5B2B6
MNFSIQSLYNWYRGLLRNPKYRWWVILGTIVYILSPVDIAPDFLPVVGQLDDVLVLTILVTELSGLVIDGWKARKGETNTSTDSNPSDNTVDVDAVSVK